jgi:tellurite resistance protein TerC
VKQRAGLVFGFFAAAFSVGVYFFMGSGKWTEFITAYLIEKSLSVDNLFVFLVIFTYFHIPQRYQHRVLFWGVIGALVMRVLMIMGGITLLERVHWLIYVFGAFLVFTGFRLATDKGHQIQPEKTLIVRLFANSCP